MEINMEVEENKGFNMRKFWGSSSIAPHVVFRRNSEMYCVYCGERADTREHCPSKAFLRKPFPTDLPTVPACKKSDYIDGEIRCGIRGDDFWCGSVEVYIEIEKLKNEHRAGFGYLEVPSKIGNQGIGTTLMLSVIDTIRAFKEFYSVSERVTVSGWLSTADKQNGNWNKSVPFYAKIGRLADVEVYYIIKNDENHYTADEFLRISDDDGSIIYMI